MAKTSKKKTPCLYCNKQISRSNFARHLRHKHAERPLQGYEPVLIPKCVIDLYRMQRSEKGTNVVESDFIRDITLNYYDIAEAITRELQASCAGCIWNDAMVTPCNDSLHAEGCRADVMDAIAMNLDKALHVHGSLSVAQVCRAAFGAYMVLIGAFPVT